MPGKLSPFHDTLVLALEAGSYCARQNRRTSKALFAQIWADDYTGAYDRVTAFIRT